MNQFGEFTASSQVTINPSGTPKLVAPLSATKGGSPTAAPSGATQPLPTNPAFPLTQTVIAIKSTGISPANTVVAGGVSPLNGGATLTVVNWVPNGPSDFRLSIPGLGLVDVSSTSFKSASLLKGASTTGATNFRLTASNVNYAALGLWEVDAGSKTNPNDPNNTIFLGTFVTGYETPASSMPTTGTATYGGTQNVAAIVTTFQSGQLARASVLGDGAFTANFGTASLTGSFANMSVITDNGTATSMPWNNVSVSASITGNHFAGSANVTSVPATTNAYTLSGSTPPGHFDGGFYGPSANELAGVWSLTDSSHVVIGVAHGKQPQ